MKKMVQQLAVLGLVLGTLASSLSAEAAVSRSERALVVVSEMDSGGLPELHDLYTALEVATAQVPSRILSVQYGSVKLLRNEDATLTKLRQTLRSLGANPNIKAIDVILSLHGAPNLLAFADRHENTERMADFFELNSTPGAARITQQTKKKLRLMYSTACFGRSHNDDWRAVGFDTVIGARGVNANAGVEYPSLLGLWVVGQSVQTSLAPSNNDVTIAITDSPLRAAGELMNNALAEVDSKKFIRGNALLTINSDAH
jgi:hypothetical protein